MALPRKVPRAGRRGRRGNWVNRYISPKSRPPVVQRGCPGARRAPPKTGLREQLRSQPRVSTRRRAYEYRGLCPGQMRHGGCQSVPLRHRISCAKQPPWFSVGHPCRVPIPKNRGCGALAGTGFPATRVNQAKSVNTAGCVRDKCAMVDAKVSPSTPNFVRKATSMVFCRSSLPRPNSEERGCGALAGTGHRPVRACVAERRSRRR